MKNLAKEDSPTVLSVTEVSETIEMEKTRIQRNEIRRSETTQDGTQIYLRAREIYFRARRQRPVRAASIF
jgi:hypothetical protein